MKKMIGIDIGGTSIKIGLINNKGSIMKKWEIKTNREINGRYIIDDIWNSIELNLSNELTTNEILGLGVGAPGFVDKKTGLVYEAVNLGWKNYPIGKRLKEISNLPVFIENDANLAALGENWIGAGKQAEFLIAITLGTGVGSGVIVNGSILSGANGTAAEIGHIIYDSNGVLCNCGRVGCLDTIVSARGIVNQLLDKKEGNGSGSIWRNLVCKEHITAKDVFEYASKGDKDCQEVITKTTDILGKALSDVATIINPSKILIGGGVSKAGSQLLDPVIKAFQKYSLHRINEACEIKIAELGNDAGIIGAAFLVKENFTELSR
ncbi:ROK family glucokinase [Oceanobacillus neutriphilus]|uniref:Glucokinase n=1 Tax=Oceanobacillus neutriphilus TaxID=531815 RepID=A0ABQ2NW68_9BACI|nr:ROK family glucokinase [Oceanobacillus neutriphilus]GGP12068.1 glucokinase [Oceanobacillus neutriphilus]